VGPGHFYSVGVDAIGQSRELGGLTCFEGRVDGGAYDAHLGDVVGRRNAMWRAVVEAVLQMLQLQPELVGRWELLDLRVPLRIGDLQRGGSVRAVAPRILNAQSARPAEHLTHV